jgi:hypothetical protein
MGDAGTVFANCTTTVETIVVVSGKFSAVFIFIVAHQTFELEVMYIAKGNIATQPGSQATSGHFLGRKIVAHQTFELDVMYTAKGFIVTQPGSQATSGHFLGRKIGAGVAIVYMDKHKSKKEKKSSQ